jgi:hypothetical protein
LCNTSPTNSGCALGRYRMIIKAPLIVDVHSAFNGVLMHVVFGATVEQKLLILL